MFVIENKTKNTKKIVFAVIAIDLIKLSVVLSNSLPVIPI